MARYQRTMRIAAVHRFAIQPVASEVDSGLAVAARGVDRGHEALAELSFRRTGLAASVGIIVLLIAVLTLKIRNLEAPEPGSTTHHT